MYDYRDKLREDFHALLKDFSVTIDDATLSIHSTAEVGFNFVTYAFAYEEKPVSAHAIVIGKRDEHYVFLTTQSYRDLARLARKTK